MKPEVVLAVLLMATLLVGCFQQPPQGNQNATQNQTTPTKDELCAQSGGIVTVRPCCASSGDFPDTCLIGACGCSPDNSHEVKVCSCRERMCWDSLRSKCVNVSHTTPPPVNATGNATYVGIDKIYKYDNVRNFVYNLKGIPGQATQIINNTITSDTVNGTAAWLQRLDIISANAVITTKTWVDKATYGCIKEITVLNSAGGSSEQEIPCQQNAIQGIQPGSPQFMLAGRETVTVPAGTYDCDKYYSGGVTYWVAESVPVPVKIASGGAIPITLELASYSLIS